MTSNRSSNIKADFQVTYFLWRARAGKDGLAPLYIRSKQNSKKQVSYYTGLKLANHEWNKKRREPKNKPAQLLAIETKLKETYRDLALQGEVPTLADLIRKQNDPKKPTNKAILAWCDDYLRSDYSPGQKKAVTTLKANIEGFNKILTFDRLTRPRLKAFFEYLTTQGVANNSQYKRLRALVNVSNHAGIHAQDLQSYRFTYETKNSLKVRLNWQEVKAIIDTETKNELERVAKDVFLLACFSGLRISDILTLQRGERHEFHYERIQTKTKTAVLVTLHKYNAHLFHQFIQAPIPYTRQTLSRALKDVLERSGLTKETTKIQQVGNNYREKTIPKYKEISFHSGRRFYSRLLNDLGLGGEIARDELGHGFKNVTELYAGSPDHVYRVARVRKAMEGLEETLEQLAGLMKVA